MDHHLHLSNSVTNIPPPQVSRNGRRQPQPLQLPSSNDNMTHSNPSSQAQPLNIDPRLQQQQQANHGQAEFNRHSISPLSTHPQIVPSSSGDNQYGQLGYGGSHHQFHPIVGQPGNHHQTSSYPTPPHTHMTSVPSSPGYASTVSQKGLRSIPTRNGIQEPEPPLPINAPPAAMARAQMLLPSGGGGMSTLPVQPDPGGGGVLGEGGAGAGFGGDGRRRSSLSSTGVSSGRTTRVTSLTDSNGTFQPSKNDEGKYRCPNCHKTYLHAKHLKRHFLRHTGERPYQCALCKDTFSRSDILKRHFQKCQVRRGNPDGVSHLTRAHAHQQKTKEEEADISSLGVIGGGSLPPSPEGRKTSGKACDGCMKNKVRCDLQNPCGTCRQKAVNCTYSRNQKPSNSRDGVDELLQSPNFQHGLGHAVGYGAGFNFPPPTHPHAHMTHQAQLGLPEQRRLHSSISGQTGVINPLTSPEFYTQSPQDVDWASFVQPSGSSLVDTLYNNQNGGMAENGINGGNVYGVLGMLQQPAGAPYRLDESLPSWNTYSDPLQTKCDQLIDFCFNTPRALASPLQTLKNETFEEREALKQWLTPDLIKHFCSLFLTNFQGHFPMIHAPTLNISLIGDGLLMAIICTGAIYSPKGITVEQVRHLIDLTYQAVDDTDKRIQHDGRGRPPELEEVQAMLLCHILMTWHGNTMQREVARKKYQRVLGMARRAKIFEPIVRQDENAYSVLHQERWDMNGNEARLWNWNSWIEQEKRVRTIYTIYLLDTAFVLYFNAPPQIRFDEIRLPLPADDAAWDATTADECGAALGMQGDGDATKINVSGTRNPRQPMFSVAATALLQDNLEFMTGITNAFSKFILIHAIHVHMWDVEMSFIKNGLQDDPGSTNSHREHMKIVLQKWKRAWDEDLQSQYPPGTERKGFCRDALPYWYLAAIFMNAPRAQYGMVKQNDDSNVTLLTRLLKYVHNTIQNDPSAVSWRAEGAVGKIDTKYGVEELTYDMKLLFKPIEEADDQKVEGGVAG